MYLPHNSRWRIRHRLPERKTHVPSYSQLAFDVLIVLVAFLALSGLAGVCIAFLYQLM